MCRCWLRRATLTTRPTRPGGGFRLGSRATDQWNWTSLCAPTSTRRRPSTPLRCCWRTGADHDHPGMIGAAKDGTLLLDEIGELGLDLQPKLLRFLESGEVCPIGQATPFRIDVRIVAATNADIEQQVIDGRFREDL